MKTIVVTEDRAGQVLMDRLLAATLPADLYQVTVAGGRSSAESLARSYLVDGHRPVALVLDAATTDAAAVGEQELILGESMRSVGPSHPFLVLLGVPDVAECLFENRVTAEEVFGKPLTDEQWTRARFQPYRVAREVVFGPGVSQWSPSELVQVLNETALVRVADSRLIRRLRTFIQKASPVAPLGVTPV